MTSIDTRLQIFLYGGMREFTIFGDLYRIDLNDFETKTPSWTRISTEIHPKGRAAHSIVKDGTNVYVFGGLWRLWQSRGSLETRHKYKLEWTEVKKIGFHCQD